MVLLVTKVVMSVGGSSGSETQSEEAQPQDQVDPNELGRDKTWMMAIGQTRTAASCPVSHAPDL